VPAGRELGHVGSRKAEGVAVQKALLGRAQLLNEPGAPIRDETVFPSVGFAADGRVLAVGYGQAAGVWDVLARRQEYPIGPREDLPLLSAAGRLYLVAHAARDVPFDADRWHPSRPPPTVELDVRPAFSAGLPAVNARETLAAVPVEDRPALQTPLAPQVFAAAGGQRLALFRLRPGGGPGPRAEKWRELALPGRALAFAFSPDETLLAVALANGGVRLWHLGTGEELLRWAPHTTPLLAAQLGFSPDGRYLIGCDGHLATPWQVDLPKLRRELAAIGLDW